MNRRIKIIVVASGYVVVVGVGDVRTNEDDTLSRERFHEKIHAFGSIDGAVRFVRKWLTECRALVEE